MRPSYKRQIRCWLAFWTKVGALFLVTLAWLSVAATAHKQATVAREISLAALEDAIRSGLIRAWPIQEPRVAVSSTAGAGVASTSSSSSSSSEAITVLTPGGGGPAQVANPTPQLGLTLTRDGTGAKTLTSPCATGYNYYLEASLDLRTWTRVSTTTSTSTQVAFGVAESPTLVRVFYRLSGDAPPSVPPPPDTKVGDTVIFVSPTTGNMVSPAGRVSPVVTNEASLKASVR